MSDKKINVSALICYGLAAIVPILILFSFRVFYTMGYGQIVPDILLLPQIFFNGLASLAFFYYLKHSAKMEMTGTGFPLLFSFGYGLCSYGLMQESTMGNLLLFALLPLLFLCLERFVKEGRTLFLILLLSLCFCISAKTGIILSVYLLASFFVEQEKEGGKMTADFLHLAVLCLFSLLLSALFSLPQLKSVLALSGNYSYEEFGLTVPIANFFSKFLLGTVTFRAFPQLYGLHLYFGLFFMLCFILYFFNPTFSKKSRLKTFIFTLFLLCTIELFPLQYLLELGVLNTPTIFYAFFPVFWFLRTAVMGFTELLSLPKKRLCIGVSLWALIILFALSGSYLNLHPIAIQSNILFMVLFILVVLGLFSKYFDKTASLLLPCLICLELFCNMFLGTNQNFIPHTLIVEDHFVFQNAYSVQITQDNAAQDNAALEAPYLTPYAAFQREHDAGYIYDPLNVLFSFVELSKEEELAAQEYGLPDLFERSNAMCRKIGADEDLFVPVDFSITPLPSDLYELKDQGNHIFNLYQYAFDNRADYTETAYELVSEKDCSLLLYNNFTNEIFNIDVKTGEVYPVYFKFTYNDEISYNFQICAYELNEGLFEQLPDLITAYRVQQSSDSFMSIYYIGIALTCLGVFLLLLFFFNKDKEKLLKPLKTAKEKIADNAFNRRLAGHFRNNYVYWLAALIPAILFLLTMVVFSCIPFGTDSFYDQDGLFLTLPSVLDWCYNLKEGSLFYSLNGGYGYSLYANNPLGILYYPLTLLQPEQIGGVLLLGVGLCLGLSSFTMIYYLTHRLSGKRADKRDYRLLVPGLIYALNSYMLIMHGFTSWYFSFLALPLLFLAFEYLIYNKRYASYIFLLAFVIYNNLYLALYMCIFLALSFFTCNFTDFADFIKKGLRFGISSILAAGSSFFIISNTLLSSSDSFYNGRDSVFPTPGLHTSFLDQWRQFMIFSDSTAVDRNDGGITLYLGILTLLLILLYFSSKKIPLKERIRKGVLLVILFASFNGQVLSYMWNGFHYQSNVPNRYVFLLMFLCAAMAYDGLRELDRVSFKKGLISCASLMAFFSICQFWGTGNTTAAFGVTMGLVLLYGILLWRRSKLSRPVFIRLMTGLLCLELAANMFYITSTYGLTAIHVVDGFEDQKTYIEETLKKEDGFLRLSTPASFVMNNGLFYNIPTGSLFNSFVTLHQTNLAFFYGFLNSSNYVSVNYNGTPLSMALAGYHYIMLPRYNATSLPDLFHYEYMGFDDQAYYYSVPNTLSLGFYAPYEFFNLTDNTKFVPYLLNDFVSLYTDDDSEDLFTVQSIEYSEDDTLPNSFRFLDEPGNVISYEEALARIGEESGNTTAIRNLYLDLHLDPVDDGFVYLSMVEFVPIGESSDASAMRIALPYPNVTVISGDYYNYVVFHEEVFEEFYEAASRQQMEDIIIKGNHISGTTDYDEDGYTIISLPYERGFQAYLDGKEVEILDPYEAFMVIETPKGKHTIELVYEPFGMKVSLAVTGGFILLSCLLCFVLWKRQQHPSKEKQQTK